MKHTIKNVLIIALTLVNAFSFAEVADHAYVRMITNAENLIAQLFSDDVQKRAQNVGIIKEILTKLKANTTIKKRLKRINDAWADLEFFVKQQPKQLDNAPTRAVPRNVNALVPAQPALAQALIPEPRREQALQPVVPRDVLIPAQSCSDNAHGVQYPQRIPAGDPEAEKIVQQIQAQLVYIRSLLSTAELAAVVNQKENALSALNQAKSHMMHIQKIVAEHHAIAWQFTDALRDLDNRIVIVTERIRLMN